MRQFEIGDVIESSVGKFAKIISFKNGVYGISGWTDLENAKNATSARTFLNIYGVQNANFQLVSSTGKPKAKRGSSAKTVTARKPRAPKTK